MDFLRRPHENAPSSLPKMKIVSVTPTEYYGYIPIKGLDAVEDALNLFASGNPKGSRNAGNQLMKDIGDTFGGEAVAYYVLGESRMDGNGNTFVKDRIMNEARAILATRDAAHFSFDYDGWGPFRKTTINIQVLDRSEDLYALRIYAAYVGEKPEIGLAEALEVERGLLWAAANIETEPVGKMFEFNLTYVLMRLVEDMDTESWLMGAVSPVEIADSFLKQIGKGDKPSLLIYKSGDLSVTLAIKDVERPIHYVDGKYQLTWSCEDGVVRGPLLKSYTDPNAYQAPLFSIFVQGASVNEDYRTKIIYLPGKKAEVLALRDQIAAVFQLLISA